MSTFNESDHPRTSAGVTAGGQFTTKAKGEPAVSLDGRPAGLDLPAGQGRVVADAVRQLAEAVGAPRSRVQVEASTVQMCGVEAGSAWVRARVVTDDYGAQVAVAFMVDPRGGTSELSVSESWTSGFDPDDGETSRATDSAYDPLRQVTDESVAALVSDVRRQARVQRALDRVLNDPQRAALPAYRRSFEVYRTAARVVDGRLCLELDDYTRSTSPHRTILRVASSGVEAATVETEHGRLKVDDSSLDALLGSIDRELTRSLGGDPSARSGSRAHLEALFADAFGRA